MDLLKGRNQNLTKQPNQTMLFWFHRGRKTTISANTTFKPPLSDTQPGILGRFLKLNNTRTIQSRDQFNKKNFMITTLDKASLLHNVARTYVLKGLGEKNFDAIPYAEDVELRAPLCAGGSQNPLKGKENIRQQWWEPLPSLVGKVTLVDTYINADKTSVAVEFYLDIISPACTLRVMDRFTVNEEGEIIEQENFFDPRDVTNPGWR
jgi:hypothetical protein